MMETLLNFDLFWAKNKHHPFSHQTFQIAKMKVLLNKVYVRLVYGKTHPPKKPYKVHYLHFGYLKMLVIQQPQKEDPAAYITFLLSKETLLVFFSLMKKIEKLPFVPQSLRRLGSAGILSKNKLTFAG